MGLPAWPQAELAGARAARRARPLQGGRRRAREAVLPARDVPRHGDEPGRGERDHRALVRLVLHLRGGSGRRRRGLAGARATRRRPTPARRASSRGPTGTSTSSSTCCGSSSGPTRSSSAPSGSRPSCSSSSSRCRSSTCGASGASLRRPVAIVAAILVVLSMGVLTYKGATAEEGVGNSAELVDAWFADLNLPEEVRPGAELFAESNCIACHQYGGVGNQGPGPGPDRDRQREQRRLLRALRREPVRVRQQRHARLRRPGRAGPPGHGSLPRGVQGRLAGRLPPRLRPPGPCTSSSASPAPRARRTPRACSGPSWTPAARSA